MRTTNKTLLMINDIWPFIGILLVTAGVIYLNVAHII